MEIMWWVVPLLVALAAMWALRRLEPPPAQGFRPDGREMNRLLRERVPPGAPPRMSDHPREVAASWREAREFPDPPQIGMLGGVEIRIHQGDKVFRLEEWRDRG